MNALEALIAARELISTPERWTKGAFGRDAGGEPVTSYGKDAVCWCSEGALRMATENSYPYGAIAQFIDLGIPHLPTWNDHPDRTHAEVLAAFDRAIEAERAAQP